MKKNNKPNINELITSNNLTDAVITLASYIYQLCLYGDRVDELTRPQPNFYFVQILEGEVDNGGFNQFFFNPSGIYAHETISALTTIGAHKTAGLLKTAIYQFPNAQIPKDTIKRREVLEEIEEEANKIFYELENIFYAAPENLAELSMEYVKSNREFFN